MAPLPASASDTDTPVICTAPSSTRNSVPGTVSNGASLTARTVSATVSVSVRVPPAPLWPRSLLVIVSVSLPTKPASAR